MRKLIIVIIALIAFSGVLSADFFTGNDLLARLEKNPEYGSDNLADTMLASGYVAGVFDSHDGLLFVSPEGVTVGQVKDIAINYLKKHPEKRHESAMRILVEAFTEAFPKKKNNNPYSKKE